MKDGDGRRPEDWSSSGARFVADLSSLPNDGRVAAERALSRIGAKKGESVVLPMAVEARAAGRILRAMSEPLSARALQQKRSFLEGKLGTAIGSEKLTLRDDPHLVRGFGSRLFDSEGLAARPIPLFEGGVLKSYYIDTYYGRKLEMKPTTAALSNLSWTLGDKDRDALLADMKEGILVTSFLGGNSNSTTGDFSLGISGFRVRDGRPAEPVSEMNIAGNLGTVFQRLVAVGNDPYAYSALRTPTLVFDGIQFAGS